jgi:hypothetical protein
MIVRTPAARGGGPIAMITGGDVDLTTDDRSNSRVDCGLVELESTDIAASSNE